MAVEELFPTSECACLSQNVTYQCTVCGGVFTVWSFPIPGDCRIILRHNNFLGIQKSIECNNVTAVAQGLAEENDCYTSELMVTVRPPMTIECAFNDGVNSRVINSSEVTISSGMLIEFIAPGGY